MRPTFDEILGRLEDAHAAPGVQDKQVVVAADDHPGAGGERQLEILVVLCVAAVRHPLGRTEPRRPDAQDVDDARPPRGRDGRSEAGPRQHARDLRVHLGRQREHVGFLGAQQRPLGNAVLAQGSTHHGRSVEDDQVARAAATLRVVGLELGVDLGVGQAGRTRLGLRCGDRLRKFARAGVRREHAADQASHGGACARIAEHRGSCGLDVDGHGNGVRHGGGLQGGGSLPRAPCPGAICSA